MQQTKLTTKKIDLSVTESESVITEESSFRFQCPQCNQTLFSASEKCESCSSCKTSVVSDGRKAWAGDCQSEQVNEPLSPKQPDKQLQRRITAVKRPVRRKVVDPSDLSLAIALSESLQSANENARKLEEELLITVQFSQQSFFCWIN